MTTAGNLLYAQSGGVTSVINITAAAVIETARKYPDTIHKVYAGKDGILGVLNEELIDTSLESPQDIRAIRHTPSGAFGTCRYKLQDPEVQKSEFKRVVDVCERYNIRHVLYNGGGGFCGHVSKTRPATQNSYGKCYGKSYSENG